MRLQESLCWTMDKQRNQNRCQRETFRAHVNVCQTTGSLTDRTEARIYLRRLSRGIPRTMGVAQSWNNRTRDVHVRRASLYNDSGCRPLRPGASRYKMSAAGFTLVAITRPTRKKEVRDMNSVSSRDNNNHISSTQRRRAFTNVQFARFPIQYFNAYSSTSVTDDISPPQPSRAWIHGQRYTLLTRYLIFTRTWH